MSVYVEVGDFASLDTGAWSDAELQKWIDKAEISLSVALAQRGVSIVDLATNADRLPVLKDTIENAVLRVARNPDGVQSESEGDYSYSTSPLDSAGNIWWPLQALDALAPAGAAVGSIRLGLPGYGSNIRWQARGGRM